MEYHQIYETVVTKIRNNARRIGADIREFPASADGKYFNRDGVPLRNLYVWTPSFFTGMAGIALRTHGGTDLLQWLYSLYAAYDEKIRVYGMDTMHDTGFLYSLYAVDLYKLTGDPNARELGLRAADTLAKRFIPNGGYIRAWERMDDTVPDGVPKERAAQTRRLAIIDCMMNLPLLFWAHEQTGHTFYRDVAAAHADVTLKRFIRRDASVCHAAGFHPETGAYEGEENYCGFGVGSHWARGTAWAIYGLILAYRYTGYERYFEAFERVADAFIDLCGADGIPAWDFRLPPGKPALRCGGGQEGFLWDETDGANVKYNKDTSAAAIAACAFLEAEALRRSAKRAAAAKLIAASLAGEYFDGDAEKDGILKCQNGNMSYCAFGDYYFTELLARILYNIDPAW
ncbi:MAG: glycoside hydrolase family 88 protein [Clostridiales bacterium]|jgi:unsaturated chondroitin disaccharide hydrolase|nr:glycoside hydrolase family 88 protein [Clostridiales bacterium]